MYVSVTIRNIVITCASTAGLAASAECIDLAQGPLHMCIPSSMIDGMNLYILVSWSLVVMGSSL